MFKKRIRGVWCLAGAGVWFACAADHNPSRRDPRDTPYPSGVAMSEPPGYNPGTAPRSAFDTIPCYVARTRASKMSGGELTHGCVVFDMKKVRGPSTVHGCKSALDYSSLFVKPMDATSPTYYAAFDELRFVAPPTGCDRPPLLTRHDFIHPLSLLGWTVLYENRPMTVVSFDFDTQKHELCTLGDACGVPIAVDFGGATVEVVKPRDVQSPATPLDTLAVASRVARLSESMGLKRGAPDPGPSDFIIPPTNGDVALASAASSSSSSSSSSSGTVGVVSAFAALPPRVLAPAAPLASPPPQAPAQGLPPAAQDNLVAELSRRAKLVLHAHRISAFAMTVVIIRDQVPSSSRLVPNLTPSDSASAMPRADGSVSWALPLNMTTTIGDVRRVVDAMPGFGPAAPRHVLSLMTRPEPLADDVRVCTLLPDIAVENARVVRLRATYDDRGPGEQLVVVFAFDRTPYAIRVAIASTRTIRVVRETIAMATAIPSADVELVFNGRALGDADIVGHTGIAMLSIVAVITPEKYHEGLCARLGV